MTMAYQALGWLADALGWSAGWVGAQFYAEGRGPLLTVRPDNGTGPIPTGCARGRRPRHSPSFH